MTKKKKQLSYKSLKSFADPDGMMVEAIRHWFETADLKHREYIEAVFIDHDREIYNRTYDGDRLPSSHGLKIFVFHSDNLPFVNKQWKTPIEPFDYRGTSDFTNFLSGMFDFEKYEVEVYAYSDFMNSTKKNRNHCCPDHKWSSGYVIRLKDEPIS